MRFISLYKLRSVQHNYHNDVPDLNIGRSPNSLSSPNMEMVKGFHKMWITSSDCVFYHGFLETAKENDTS